MPLQFYQTPTATADQVPVLTNWTPIVGYTLYQSDTTINGFFYYQLAIAVYQGFSNTSPLIATLKQRRNGYSSDVSQGSARAIFDLRDIVNSVLVDTISDQNCDGVPFGSIHQLGDNEYSCASDTGDPLYPCKPLYSRNGDRNTGNTQIAPISVYGYEFYSTDVNSSPSNQPATAPSGSSPNDTKFYIKGTLPLTANRHITDAGTDPYVFQGNNMFLYQPRANYARFLSDVNKEGSWSHPAGASLEEQYINYVRDIDYHTVAFLNDYTYFGARLNRMRITFYSSTGAELGSGDVLNSNVAATPYGGCPPDNSESGGTPPNVLGNSKRLLYFGCGPMNLTNQTIDNNINPTDIINRGWVYYKLQGISNSDTLITAPYYFVKIDQDCKGYESVRLSWRNSFGCYDYFTFTKKSKQQTKIKRTTFDTMLGIYNKSVWRYNNTDRGINVNEVTGTQEYTLNSDFLDESQVPLMEKLLLSKNVEIVKNRESGEGDISHTTVPVLIKDTSFTKKTILNDKVKIQYTIKIELANKINTNS